MAKKEKLSLNMVLAGKEDGKIHREYDDKPGSVTERISLKESEPYKIIDSRVKKFTKDIIANKNTLNAQSYLFGFKIGYSPEHYKKENDFVLQQCLAH